MMRPGTHDENSTKTDQEPEQSILIGRQEEQAQLTELMADPGRHHLHIYGPRGCGKSLLADQALSTVSDDTGYYVHCINADTQYKVLKNLYETIKGKPIGTGYHTSKLQHVLADLLNSTGAVIVLDEVDFLLNNDGSDLLYYLTRIANHTLSIITISANHQDLSDALDERVYSSLQPYHLNMEPYSELETSRILAHRLQHAHLRSGITQDALSAISETTSNIRLALHWAAEALRTADEAVTAQTVHEVRQDALYRYWDTLLSDFTHHHHLLVEAVLHLSHWMDPVHTGAVYDHYHQFCNVLEEDAFTPRRLSQFLKHLELLNIVDADYHYGGPRGKTRSLRLQQL